MQAAKRNAIVNVTGANAAEENYKLRTKD